MVSKDWGQILFLIVAIAVAGVAAYMVGGVYVWKIIFVIAMGAVLVAAVLVLRKLFPGLSERSSPSVSIPQHLNPRFAERVAEAKDRLTTANQQLTTFQSALTAAESAFESARTITPATDPQQLAQLEQNVQQAKKERDDASAVVKFEEFQLDRLLHPSGLQGFLDRLNWVFVLQYAIFTSLALYVLINLMSGITSSPPVGTTPRSMITLLISVVVVGIALILVLSTIVAENLDEKRFSQGKEVLTALLGVLGTIVGFYFGTAQDQTIAVTFDPVVVTNELDNPISLSTSVHGGKAPYNFEATFTPPVIPPVKGKTDDGKITVPIVAKDVKQDSDVSVLITFTDSAGRTGNIDYKQAFRVKAPSKK